MTWSLFLHLHGSRPVGGEHGTDVEWRYSYQVIPPGGPAADTPADREHLVDRLGLQMQYGNRTGHA